MEKEKIKTIIESHIEAMQEFNKFLFLPVDKNISSFEFSELFDKQVQNAKASLCITSNAIGELFKLRH